MTESRYQPSREQRSLVEELDGALTGALPIARLHRAALESPEDWAVLEDLGLFGLTGAEARGGSDLGAVEEVLVAAALGRRLASSSVFAKMAAAHLDRFAAWSSPVRITAAFRNSRGLVAIDDPEADLMLVRDGESIGLYHKGRITPLEAPSPWLERFIAVVSLGEPIAAMDAPGRCRARLIDAAALAGLADAALTMAADYAKLREQFGRPIGSFQAVKHHCANMAMAARCALDLVTFAAVAVDDRRPDAAMLIDSAFLTAASAALENAGKNIQIHGGIGFSDEADAHFFLKRAQLLIAIGGGCEPVLDRLGQSVARAAA